MNKNSPKFILNFRNVLLLISVGYLAFSVSTIFYNMSILPYVYFYPSDLIFFMPLFLLLTGIVYSAHEISFGKNSLSARFNKVEQNIEIINEIVKHVLTDGERSQLSRLHEENIMVDVKYSHFLLQEMIHLCQHRFVKEHKEGDIWKMKDKFERIQDSYNLKDYFQITEEGKQYLKIIEELNKRQQEET